MDSKKFFGKIREIIREEIDYALDKKLSKSEIKTKGVSESKSRDIEFINNAKKIVDSKSKPTTKMSNYSSINDLLEETRRSLKESFDEYDQSLHFSSDSIDETNHSVIPNGVSPSEVPSEVMSALTRNYSDLMKAIDQKKGR
jgi:hypothetical protein